MNVQVTTKHGNVETRPALRNVDVHHVDAWCQRPLASVLYSVADTHLCTLCVKANGGKCPTAK